MECPSSDPSYRRSPPPGLLGFALEKRVSGGNKGNNPPLLLAEVWEKADLRLAWESRVGELGAGRAA